MKVAKGWMNAKLAIAQERVAELKGLVGSGAHHLWYAIHAVPPNQDD